MSMIENRLSAEQRERLARETVALIGLNPDEHAEKWVNAVAHKAAGDYGRTRLEVTLSAEVSDADLRAAIARTEFGA